MGWLIPKAQLRLEIENLWCTKWHSSHLCVASLLFKWFSTEWLNSLGTKGMEGDTQQGWGTWEVWTWEENEGGTNGRAANTDEVRKWGRNNGRIRRGQITWAEVSVRKRNRSSGNIDAKSFVFCFVLFFKAGGFVGEMSVLFKMSEMEGPWEMTRARVKPLN